MRHLIERQILSLTGMSLNNVNYDSPAGDPGLFGPESVCWRIHSDFPSMLCGGISALMLQMLHPLALAGVWEHSNFRDDMLGRLRRTSQFVAATTFAPIGEAERLIERVRKIHSGVEGIAPDGRHYRANDPALLTWVHTSEVYSFMQAYIRYRNPELSTALQDRYYREVALIAFKLGASEVPQSRAEVESYLRSMRKELVFDQRTDEVMRCLNEAPTPSPSTRIVSRVMFAAAFDLLPDWAQQLNSKPLSATRQHWGRVTLRAIAPTLRWSLRNGVSTLACRRLGIPALWQRPHWP